MDYPIPTPVEPAQEHHSGLTGLRSMSQRKAEASRTEVRSYLEASHKLVIMSHQELSGGLKGSHKRTVNSGSVARVKARVARFVAGLALPTQPAPWWGER